MCIFIKETFGFEARGCFFRPCIGFEAAFFKIKINKNKNPGLWGSRAICVQLFWRKKLLSVCKGLFVNVSVAAMPVGWQGLFLSKYSKDQVIDLIYIRGYRFMDSLFMQIFPQYIPK